MKPRAPFRLVTLLAALTAPLLFGQPSGGPYGPLPQSYEVPQDAKRVYFVAPNGQPDAAGTLAAPTTLEAAIAKVVTGDAIILRGGIYRTGELFLNQGITIQPYLDEQPVLKGTLVADKWESLREGVWRTKWTTLFPQKPADWWRRNREGMRTPLHKFNNDMVFVDGRPLASKFWEGELDADSYSIDYENGYVHIKFDPTGRTIEITAFDGALTRTMRPVHGKQSDGKGYIMRGLTLTQYAYRALEVEGVEPQKLDDPANFGKEVVGTTFEHVTITHCSRVAGYFRGDRTTFRHCLISDTSTEGIYIINSADCLLEKNIFTRNNVEQITGYYPSAVKIFNQSYRVVCRDNLIIDNPHSNGLWYDVGNVDGVFINNWVENCLDGFFWEISKNVLVAGNVFKNCDKGIRILNSSGAKVYHNTFYNAPASFERDLRSAQGDHFGWHPSTGPDVHERHSHAFTGNLLLADAGFSRALFRADQHPGLKDRLKDPAFDAADYNVYARPAAPTALGAAKGAEDMNTALIANLSPALIAWSPGAGETNQFMLKSPAELTAKLPQFEKNSVLLPLAPSAVVQSPELRNYVPARSLKVKVPAMDKVVELLGWPKHDAYVPGAYQN